VPQPLIRLPGLFPFRDLRNAPRVVLDEVIRLRWARSASSLPSQAHTYAWLGSRSGSRPTCHVPVTGVRRSAGLSGRSHSPSAQQPHMGGPRGGPPSCSHRQSQGKEHPSRCLLVICCAGTSAQRPTSVQPPSTRPMRPGLGPRGRVPSCDHGSSGGKSGRPATYQAPGGCKRRVTVNGERC
jgi:hypothetical protein